MINPSNILIGSLLSLAVSQLKRIPFIKKNPKVVVAILSTAIPATFATIGAIKGIETQSWQDLATQAATLFTSAVATHEAVVEPINNKLFDP